jgi:Transposase IS4
MHVSSNFTGNPWKEEVKMPPCPMNSKGRSTDHDFVPPTQYKLGSRKTKLPDLSPLELVPNFEAMDLIDSKSSCQIPIEIDSSSPKALFSLFFSASVIDLIVQCTNRNAEKARADPAASRAANIHFHESLNQRLWRPVTSDEILAYFGIRIYMGIYGVPHIVDYWNTRAKRPAP